MATEEPKLTLPAGHPQAGYVSPDLSFREPTGPLPEKEQAWNDDRDDARKDEAETVAENEHKVAKAEAEEKAKTEKADEPAPKTSTKASASST